RRHPPARAELRVALRGRDRARLRRLRRRDLGLPRARLRHHTRRRAAAPRGVARAGVVTPPRLVPAPLLVLGAVLSVQFGGALAATLVPQIGAAGSVVL